MSGILPAMLVGVVVNSALLLAMYWKLLSDQKNDEEDPAVELEEIAEEDVCSHRFSPATMSHLTSLNSQEWKSVLETSTVSGSPNINGHANNHAEAVRNRGNTSENEILKSTCTELESSKGEEEGVHPKRTSSEKEEFAEWKRLLWKIGVYLITVGMLIALLIGLDMSWTAITAALALVVLDFKDACPCLEKVSYLLLIFFCGMFITIDGFNRTGIPSALWDFMEPYSKINHISGIAILALVILFLSNLASNVPTVLLLGARVAASAAAISPADERKAWLILAWVSTVAGNLSLLGSAANLIVCEQARRAQFGYNLTFWNHLKFGFPATLIVTAIGLTLIK